MHEYETLYRSWKRYRLKKLVIKSTLATLFLALFAGGYLFYKESFHRSNKKLIEKTKENIILPSKDFETKLRSYTFKKNLKQKRSNKKIKHHTKAVQNLPVHKLLIQSQNTTLEDLKAAFNAAPTSQKALLVAQRYYEKKEYKNAVKWAYKANTLDSSNEESWLLFAKALAKDGKRQKALTILQIYYKKSGSPRAKILIQKIIDGDFR